MAALTLNLPADAGRLLLGLSGGADSMALFRLLLDCGADFTAVHVNHGLRGEASDGDAAFVQRVCREAGVPLQLYRLDPPDKPGEGWAREERYACFRRALRESGADALVLAHHRDDQAETMLLHLLRGTGLRGLCGMEADAAVNGLRILRPLLGYPRETLTAYLRARQIPWREDATNGDPRYLRNAVRMELLPLMERLAPGAAARMADAAVSLRADEETLDALAADFLALHGGSRALAAAPLQGLSDGLLRRVLRRWWRDQAPVKTPPAPELSFAQTEALTALVSAPAAAACSLPGGVRALRGWTHLHLTDDAPGSPAAPVPALSSPLLTLAEGGGHGDGRRTQAVPLALLERAVVRTRQTGDWIRPFGMTGRTSLKEFFIARRVDAPFRDQVPLLCVDSEVLMAGGTGASERLRKPLQSEEKTVLIRWNGAFPWQTHDDAEGGNQP